LAFESLSNDEISAAIGEMIPSLGVKEEEPFEPLSALILRKDLCGCGQEIASRLGLPVRILLSYVPKDFRPGDGVRFQTSGMSRTDKDGRGIDAITAQVFIPQSLPMFGTSKLQGYPIEVRVSEDCQLYPETFVAIMAHELSHVLLRSLCHPMRESEFYTDLVPILLGFRDVVKVGRKVVQRSTTESGNTTYTTTYGYLKDSQFDFAYRHVTEIVEDHRNKKRHLLATGGKLQRKLKTASRRLAAFRDHFAYLDKHPPKKMKPEHAQRVVQLHAQDYGSEWEGGITAVKKRIEAAEKFATPIKHYTSSAVMGLNNHRKALESATNQLNEVTEAIVGGERVLRRYVGFIYRLRRALP